MRSARTNLAYAAAVVTLLLGLLALLNPSLVARLSGLAVLEPRGLSTLRSSHGALYLVLGGAMLWAVPKRPRSAPWLRFAALLWLGVAAGRLASMLLDGVGSPLNLSLLLLELALGSATAWASFERPVPRTAQAAPREPSETVRRPEG